MTTTDFGSQHTTTGAPGCTVSPTRIHNIRRFKTKGSRVRYQCTFCLRLSRWVPKGRYTSLEFEERLEIEVKRPADLNPFLMGEPSKALLEGKGGNGVYALGKAYTEGIIEELKDRFKEIAKIRSVHEHDDNPADLEEALAHFVGNPTMQSTYYTDGQTNSTDHTVQVPLPATTTVTNLRAQYNDLTRDGLRALCKKRGLTHYGHLNKQNLVDLLLADDANQAQQG